MGSMEEMVVSGVGLEGVSRLPMEGVARPARPEMGAVMVAVSYTHLTLPTNPRV